jgi:hypothetical protein
MVFVPLAKLQVDPMHLDWEGWGNSNPQVLVIIMFSSRVARCLFPLTIFRYCAW